MRIRIRIAATAWAFLCLFLWLSLTAASAEPIAKITAGDAVLLTSAGSQGVTAWRAEPPEAMDYCELVEVGRQTADDGTVTTSRALLFRAWQWEHRPQVVFQLIATDGQTIKTDRYVVPADGGPAPDPFPNPDPNPQPDPQPPIKVAEVVVVYESDPVDKTDQAELNRLAAQAEVVLDKTWRDALKAKSVPFQVLDQDQLPARLQPLKARAAGRSMVFFVGESGDMVKALMVALPVTVAEMLKLIGEKVK